jgi:hypothetical protein
VKRSPRLSFLMAIALLPACGTEPTPPLEGLWSGSEPGRGNHWELRFRDEGGGVIGRATEKLSGTVITYFDVPVTGRYPRVQFETGPLTGPLSPIFANQHALFVGALRSKCPGRDRSCIIGTVTKFDGTQVLSSDTVEFYRLAE